MLIKLHVKCLIIFICLIGCISLSVSQPDNGSASDPGWLIIDGRPISGPYEIIIKDNILFVNNIPLSVPEPEPMEIDVTSFHNDRHNLLKHAYDLFINFCDQMDEDEARKKVCEELLKNRDILACSTNEQGIEIRFKDQNLPEFVTLEKHTSQPLIDLKAQTEKRAIKLREWLSHDCLVIWNKGILFVSRVGEGAELFNQIDECCKRYSDLKQCSTELQKLIPDIDIASSIAKNFVSK